MEKRVTQRKGRSKKQFPPRLYCKKNYEKEKNFINTSFPGYFDGSMPRKVLDYYLSHAGTGGKSPLGIEEDNTVVNVTFDYMTNEIKVTKIC